MASGLYRRKIPFHYAGIFYPDEPDFASELGTFARAVAVTKGLRNARIGQVGVRPATFETVGYDEAAMVLKFGQNVVYANLSDIVDRAKSYSDDDPAVQEIVADIQRTVPEVGVAGDYVLSAAKMEAALVELEEQVAKIQEESRRRSMVVT
jgi:L-fucose isomerase-like protein